MILSRIFIDDTRMLECWAYNGLVARMILPLGLNVRSAGLSLKSVMLPPPTDAIEREERRASMWFAVYHDTIASAASGWGTSIALDELVRSRTLLSEPRLTYRASPFQYQPKTLSLDKKQWNRIRKISTRPTCTLAIPYQTHSSWSSKPRSCSIASTSLRGNGRTGMCGTTMIMRVWRGESSENCLTLSLVSSEPTRP